MNHKKRKVLLLGCMLLLFIIIIACATQPIAQVTQTPEAQVTPKAEAKPVSPYALEIIPMTPADCGRCHSTVYNQIKKEGGKDWLSTHSAGSVASIRSSACNVTRSFMFTIL